VAPLVQPRKHRPAMTNRKKELLPLCKKLCKKPPTLPKKKSRAR
jgi:hypothetical protein